MEAHEYPLRSKGGVIIQRSNTPTLKKSRNQPRKAPKEIPIDTDSDASCTSSTTTESTCTESTEAESSTINKPHTLHRIERSEDTDASSSESSDSESASSSESFSDDEQTSYSDYHPSSTIDQEALTPDYTGITLSREIQTDEALYKWLASNGLLAEGLTCPIHSIEMEIQTRLIKGNQAFLWTCPEEGCTAQCSILTNTIFSLFRSHPRKVLFVILDWLLGHQRSESAVSSGLTKNTISRANILLRVCAYIIITRNPQASIGGEGTVVEVDEAELHRRKAKRGRVKQAGWVVGGVQRGPAGSLKPCFFELVENRSAAVLLDVIRRHVKPQTTIVTDAWKGYTGLDAPNSQYSHAIINHSTRFSDGAGIYTQTIEGIWHHLRRSALPSHGCNIVDIEYYICQHLLRKMTGLNLVQTIKLLNSVDPEEVLKHMKQRKKLIHRERKLAHKWKKEQERKKEARRLKHWKALAEEELNQKLPDNIKQLLSETADVQKKAKASSAKATYDRLKKVQDGILPKKN